MRKRGRKQLRVGEGSGSGDPAICFTELNPNWSGEINHMPRNRLEAAPTVGDPVTAWRCRNRIPQMIIRLLQFPLSAGMKVKLRLNVGNDLNRTSFREYGMSLSFGPGAMLSFKPRRALFPVSPKNAQCYKQCAISGAWLQCSQFRYQELALVFSPSNLFEAAAISQTTWPRRPGVIFSRRFLCVR
jgi:hypothetical protein